MITAPTAPPSSRTERTASMTSWVSQITWGGWAGGTILQTVSTETRSSGTILMMAPCRPRPQITSLSLRPTFSSTSRETCVCRRGGWGRGGGGLKRCAVLSASVGETLQRCACGAHNNFFEDLKHNGKLLVFSSINCEDRPLLWVITLRLSSFDRERWLLVSSSRLLLLQGGESRSSASHGRICNCH